jgi:hypothetical protein
MDLLGTRCELCRWWSREFVGYAETLTEEQAKKRLRNGECVLFRDPDLDDPPSPTRPECLASTSAHGYEVDGARFHTRDDFGCVQWEAK